LATLVIRDENQDKDELRTMPQLDHNRVIEKHLWTAADSLRTDSNYTSNKYFLPFIAMVFPRYAYSCNFLQVRLMSRGVIA